MHTSEPWLSSRLNEPYHFFMRVCYVLRGTGMKEGGLILHPEELGVLEVQGKDGNICTL